MRCERKRRGLDTDKLRFRRTAAQHWRPRRTLADWVTLIQWQPEAVSDEEANSNSNFRTVHVLSTVLQLGVSLVVAWQVETHDAATPGRARL